MAFWGLGDTGKDARGTQDEINRWNFARAKDQYGKADEQYSFGNYYRDYLAGLYGDMARGEFGSPEDLTALGNRIMPWVDQTVADRRSRDSQQQQNYNNIGPIDNTINARSGRLDELGGNIGRNYDALEGDIRDLRGRSEGRENNYHNDIVGNIQGTFGSLRGNSRDVYGGLLDSTGQTFDTAIKDVMPGSQFRAATASRAFAPQVASTMARLRRAGIDPASTEGQSLLGRVEGQRSRAIDDQLGQAITDTNNLRISKQGATNDLTLGALGNDQNLGLDELGQVTGEKLRNLGASQGMDREFTGMSMDNRENAFNRGQDYQRARMDEDLMARNLREGDVMNRNSFLDKQNETDLLANDLYMQRYGAGVDAQGRNIDYRQRGMTGLEGQQAGAYDNARFGNTFGANRFDQAYGGYGNTYQREAANAGWGKKLLLGAGSAVADYFLPGSGQMIRGAAGIGGNQQPSGYYSNPQMEARAQSTYSSLYPQMPNVNTYDFNQQPRFRAGAPSQWTSGPGYGYDASKFQPQQQPSGRVQGSGYSYNPNLFQPRAA